MAIITPRELRKVSRELRHGGFSKSKIDKLQGFTAGNMDQGGIGKTELRGLEKTLKHKGHFSSDERETINEALEEQL